ncbi:hypothetical protein FHT12_001770 [Xanthomonas campestris]|uniref:hypothetical protein n=1 Tax=Xanthomonas euroxanthea TaxID=2259622 RepID=UPI00141B7CBC|nr:hypothetical protein [Xanthomonas euroxanthea]NIJ93073.1 hypothetical protein [Xanthomonas euroxanthea]
MPVIGYSTLMVWPSVWLAPGASSITSGPALAAARADIFFREREKGWRGAGDRLLDADGLARRVMAPGANSITSGPALAAARAGIFFREREKE